MARTIVGSQNPVTIGSLDANGDPVTDNSGNPAANFVLPDGLGSLEAGGLLSENLLRIEKQAAYTECTVGTTVVASEAGRRFKGFICTSAVTTITIYDNTAASGTVLYPTLAASLGDIVELEHDLVVKTGITVVIATGGTVLLLWE